MKQQFWHSVLSPWKNGETSSGSRWLCVETAFVKEVVVIFGFRLVWRCLSAALYFIRNQSVTLQENSPAGTQRKDFLWRKISWSARENVWKQEPNFESHAAPRWLQTLVDFLLKCFPLGCDMNVLSKDATSVTTLLPLPTNGRGQKQEKNNLTFMTTAPETARFTSRGRKFTYVSLNASFLGMLMQ